MDCDVDMYTAYRLFCLYCGSASRQSLAQVPARPGPLKRQEQSDRQRAAKSMVHVAPFASVIFGQVSPWHHENRWRRQYLNEAFPEEAVLARRENARE